MSVRYTGKKSTIKKYKDARKNAMKRIARLQEKGVIVPESLIPKQGGHVVMADVHNVEKLTREYIMKKSEIYDKSSGEMYKGKDVGKIVKKVTNIQKRERTEMTKKGKRLGTKIKKKKGKAGGTEKMPKDGFNIYTFYVDIVHNYFKESTQYDPNNLTTNRSKSVARDAARNAQIISDYIQKARELYKDKKVSAAIVEIESKGGFVEGLRLYNFKEVQMFLNEFTKALPNKGRRLLDIMQNDEVMYGDNGGEESEESEEYTE